MRFIIDTQLPRRLGVWIRAQSHEADHVLDLNLAQSGDNAIWRTAIEKDAVIISKDDDFANWVMAGREGPAVVWVRTGNGSNAQLIAILAPLWSAVLARLSAGERLVEIRR